MQLGDLSTHLNTELGIEVGQRFVHQEDLRLTNNSTAQSNTLTLTTGKSLRLTVEQLLDRKDLGRLTNAGINLLLGFLAQLQTECHVVINGHVRIQSVVLENHRDIAVLRSNIVYQTIADVQFTF